MTQDIKIVTVIVPCRNERHYIEPFCRSVLGQLLPTDWTLELLIADGMSNDGTRQLLNRLSATDPSIQCVDNVGRIVSTGLNRALALAKGEVIIRMDVHTEYAPDYVAQCISVLAETGADNVGGAWHARPDADAGPMQEAVAAAFQSRWVAGGALSRKLDHDGWVDTVYLGCWPKATFQRFGGFDESLVRNQDDEHNLRLLLAGGRVWQSSRIRSVYRPRSSFLQVLRQYMQYGYWKPFVIRKHGQAASLRHFAPSIFVGMLVLLSLAAVAGAPVWPFQAWTLLYGCALFALTVGVIIDRSPKPAASLLVPAVIIASHFGYGIGTFFGWWDVLFRGKGRNRFATLTR